MKAPIINEVDRFVIRRYYEDSEGKSGWWKWWCKPSVVGLYEALEPKRELQREIDKIVHNIHVKITKLLKNGLQNNKRKNHQTRL